MLKIVADVPDDINKNIAEKIKLGIFSDMSEAVSSALKKSYARKNRSYLRRLIKREGILEADMLKELKAIRR